MSAAGRVLRVQPGEGRTVLLMVAVMFAATAGFTIGESGVSALFLERVGTDALPTIFLAQGAIGLVAMLVLTGSLGRVDRRRAYIVLPVGSAVVVLVERVILAADPGWIYPVLWLMTAVAMLVQAIFLWGTAGLVTDTRRAKRLFPLFAAGGILGAVAGGLVTGPLALWIGAENLLLVWAAALGCSAILCASVLGVRRRPRLRPRRRRPSALRELGHGLSFVRRSPLLVWMTAAAILFSVLFFSLYLPFARAATARYPDPDELAGFLGIYWAGVMGAALVVSVIFANRMLGWFGAGAVILVLPVLYAGSFGILLATTTFTTVVATRFAVGVWLQGVASPAWETLVNVVPESRRDQTRAFLNGGPAQVGTAIAGVLQLVGQQALSARQLSLIGLVAAAITVLVTRRIRRSYAGALVDALRLGRPSVFEEGGLVGVPVVVDRDAQALDMALVASRDPDFRVRRLAVEMLAGGAEARARDALIVASDDDDALVRARAVTGLGRDPTADDLPLLERALADPDPVVRLASVEALREAPSPSMSLRPLLSDPDSSVAAAAAVRLLGMDPRPEAAEALRRTLADEDPEVRAAALHHLRSAAAKDVLAFASPLSDDPSPAVRAAVLETLTVAGPRAVILPALERLGEDDPSVRSAAFHTLSGLDLPGYEKQMRSLAEERASLAAHDGALAASIPSSGDVSELLRDALLDRARRHAVVALSALALLSEERDAMHAALDNLYAPNPGQLPNALETLEVAAHTPLARSLLALWETAGSSTTAGREDWLERATEDEDPFIRSCAELVQTIREQGDDMGRSRTSMSPMDRVLALRRIPLFAELSPLDLQRVAGIAEERTYADGDVIASEGELGEELHIVLAGSVGVLRDGGGAAIARRGPGDVVGEMSIITREPRVASLVAEGDVRTLRIGHREFESMIRERPDVALAVMRVLAERLGAETAGRHALEGV